jgi:hypothetical protein
MYGHTLSLGLVVDGIDGGDPDAGDPIRQALGDALALSLGLELAHRIPDNSILHINENSSLK